MNSNKKYWNDKANEWHEVTWKNDSYWSLRMDLIGKELEKHAKKGLSVLDVGCGPGYLTQLLMESGYQVHAADISSNMIQRVKEITGLPADRFCLCHDEELPFPDKKFDVIIAVGILEYIHKRGNYIAALSSILEPGGILILGSSNNRSLFVILSAASRIIRYPFNPSQEAREIIGNMWRTGIWSGGNLDHSRTDDAYSARALDRLVENCGFTLVDGIDLMNFSWIDRSPLRKLKVGRWITRKLGWNHIGFYTREK